MSKRKESVKFTILDVIVAYIMSHNEHSKFMASHAIKIIDALREQYPCVGFIDRSFKVKTYDLANKNISYSIFAAIVASSGEFHVQDFGADYLFTLTKTWKEFHNFVLTKKPAIAANLSNVPAKAVSVAASVLDDFYR